ncbi:MAG: CDP-diacylglycerol--serine O-phosphatidyltransferase [Candidatus Methanogaster sp.]|uniref:CDP-diacylglycerol--serine O-phosphatidyltransferase n=1 Tax=Candidatus Methanogaster sp. TaxID=3386292 RepID=A0AC61L3Z3_9EURY|nr:MAG: CDP-diacylglycerol--serine O-phosphatidyltransferase [ANME-2 cluster archaeon]
MSSSSSSEHETGIIRLIRLPDLVTILNILFGFTAILFVLNGYVYDAIILILAAALADGVDGAVARRFESGIFGEHLDSFADIISFGVAPAVIYYAIVSDYNHALVCAVSAAYLICGTLRLVRFGIIDLPVFRGLPITAAGTFAVLLLYTVDSQYLAIAATCIFVVLSVLMISSVQYPKVRSMGVLILLAAVFIFTIAAHYARFCGSCNWFAWVLFVLVGIYMICPFIGCSRLFE